MKTKKEKTEGKAERVMPTEQKKKSTYTLFREKYPNGIGEIVNMRAVLR
jgi:hypothetical protein